MSATSIHERHTKTTSLILRRVSYGEKDWILTLLTKEHGLLSCFARHGRGSRHRFAGCLDFFILFNAHLMYRKPNSLLEITGADLIQTWEGLYEDFQRLQTAQVALAITKDLLADAEAEPVIFDALVSCLSAIATRPPEYAHLPLLTLTVQILESLGCIHEPEIFLATMSLETISQASAYRWITKHMQLALGRSWSLPMI